MRRGDEVSPRERDGAGDHARATGRGGRLAGRRGCRPGIRPPLERSLERSLGQAFLPGRGPRAAQGVGPGRKAARLALLRSTTQPVAGSPAEAGRRGPRSAGSV